MKISMNSVNQSKAGQSVVEENPKVTPLLAREVYQSQGLAN